MANLVIKSLDKPGQIGRIGSCLGGLGVGILQIQIEDAEEPGKIFIPVTVKLSDRSELDQVINELCGIEGVLDINKK